MLLTREPSSRNHNGLILIEIRRFNIKLHIYINQCVQMSIRYLLMSIRYKLTVIGFPAIILKTTIIIYSFIRIPVAVQLLIYRVNI